MSSMKSFKSKNSHQRGNSQSKQNMSMSQSVAQYNLKNVFMNVQNRIQFKLQKLGDKISVVPAKLQITNNSGVRIFVHIISSKDQYFSISPKKYILQNGNSYQTAVRLIEIPYVQFESYQSQSFQVNWGRISSAQIANKQIPILTESKVLSCIISNKAIVNEFLAKTSYQNRNSFDQVRNGLGQIGSNFGYMKNNTGERNHHNVLQINNLNQISRTSHINTKSQYARSGLNAADLKIGDSLFQQRVSLLRTNIIIVVAVISFIIGFISG